MKSQLASGLCKAALTLIISLEVVRSLEQGNEAAQAAWSRLAPSVRRRANQLVRTWERPTQALPVNPEAKGLCVCAARCYSCDGYHPYGIPTEIREAGVKAGECNVAAMSDKLAEACDAKNCLGVDSPQCLWMDSDFVG